MPWLHTGKVIRVGRAWTDSNGIQHPTNWNRWSDEEKKAKGLVWMPDPKPFDNRFYRGWDEDGNLIPKALEDSNAVDENGDAVLDANGDQVVNRGLKSIAIEKVKSTAGGLLASTDWYIVREAETGVATPEKVSTYRAAVREAADTIETAISDAIDLDAFMELYETPTDEDGVATGTAPINDFPEAI
jgi:hypothetical protein